MHEFSMAQELVEAAANAARSAKIHRMNKVVCRVGVLRQVEESLLGEAFRIAAKNTLCANAELQIEKTYMRAYCPGCKREFDVRDWVWLCPTCGATGADGLGGDELILMSIEGETDDVRTRD